METALYREQMAAQGMHPQTCSLSRARICYKAVVPRTSILKYDEEESRYLYVESETRFPHTKRSHRRCDKPAIVRCTSIISNGNEG